jgi:hypothetical protein
MQGVILGIRLPISPDHRPTIVLQVFGHGGGLRVCQHADRRTWTRLTMNEFVIAGRRCKTICRR